MKITLLTPALAAILGLALASVPLPIHAQTNTTTTSSAPAPAPTKSKKASGTLTAVDTTGNTITINNKMDGSRTFAIASTATFIRDKKPATLADFAVGDKITLRYTKDASGTMTATKLYATPPKPASTTTSTTSSSAPAATTAPAAVPATPTTTQ
ncbi:MAG: DUF5666 domain-containing protein [Methylacidiphilales bacterium]|nr:DUF5666 domain-containing protein [Candidatus Methylacidiphilales bacterium]